MKLIFKTILKYYLKYIAKFVLLIYRPIIIVVAGSTNKTFVKNEINNVLQKLGKKTRSNYKNFNTEIGLPLTILNLNSGYNSYKNWLPIIFKVPLAIFQKNYPKYLVLELGISDSGDMKHLLSIISPKIAVITNITQRYLENFSNIGKLAGEYEYLINKIKKNNLLILNKDNQKIKLISKQTNNKIKFFGLQNNVDYQAIKINKTINGQKFIIKHKNKIINKQINKFGEHHIYASLIGEIVKKLHN